MPQAEIRTIVTAADAPYWRCLHQFLRNAERRRLTAAHRFIAYDLGLGPGLRDFLERRFAWCEFRRFAFEDFPPHVAMDAKSYAWKPLLIGEVCAQSGGLVLWLDSATLIRTANLEPVWSAIRQGGVYAVRGQASLEERCDPLTLEALGVPRDIRRRPELVAGVIGFNTMMPKVRALLFEWRAHALVEAHIAPRTPPLAFHQREQALLTILLYGGEAEGVLTLPDGEIDISSRAPIRWMTSRNIVPDWMPLWADPFVRFYYATYKRIDEALWRLDHFDNTRINGFHRLIKEHFSVLIQRTGDSRPVKIRAPRWTYYADPFLVRQDGDLWLLVEKFDYRECRAELCAVALDDKLQAGPPIPILPGRNHASFPFVFRDEGHLYLVPETCKDATVEIHECVEFPARWRLVSRVLDGVDAADSVIFRHLDLWWLITSVRRRGEGNGRALAIYFTADFRRGPWSAHPVNEARLYRERPFWSGRNAGPVFSHQGRLLRAVQVSRRFYGEGMELMEIERLTPTEFRELAFDGPHPALDIVKAFSPHHLAMEEGLAAFDIRDRARGLEGLWPLPLKRRSLRG